MKSFVRIATLFCLISGLIWSLKPSSLHAQPPAHPEPTLEVRGVAKEAVVLHGADLEKLPHQTITVKGATTTYEGVALAEVLKRAGLDLDADMHGRGLTRYLLVEAADKYRIVFSLAEIDPAFTDHVVLLATQKDGKPLTEEEGPYRLVVPDDKRQARWVRQVRILTILDSVPPSERNKKP